MWSHIKQHNDCGRHAVGKVQHKFNQLNSVLHRFSVFCPLVPPAVRLAAGLGGSHQRLPREARQGLRVLLPVGGLRSQRERLQRQVCSRCLDRTKSLWTCRLTRLNTSTWSSVSLCTWILHMVTEHKQINSMEFKSTNFYFIFYFVKLYFAVLLKKCPVKHF